MPVLCYSVCCFTMDTEIFYYWGSHGYFRDNSSAVNWFLYEPWIEGKLHWSKYKLKVVWYSKLSKVATIFSRLLLTGLFNRHLILGQYRAILTCRLVNNPYVSTPPPPPPPPSWLVSCHSWCGGTLLMRSPTGHEYLASFIYGAAVLTGLGQILGLA